MKLKALHFEIVRVLAGNLCNLGQLQQLCQEATGEAAVEAAVTDLVDSGCVRVLGCGCYSVARVNAQDGLWDRAVRVKEGVRARPGGAFRKCCGRVGIVEAVDPPNLTLRFGPRTHEYVVLPLDQVEPA